MFVSDKIALFSDLHIGVHKDSSTWHKIALDFGDWFIEKLNKNSIKDVVFCGDFFHTRHQIEQTTLSCGVEFLKKFKNFNVYMLPGNHCCYFKDNSNVHSLEPFKEWSNVKIFDKPTTVTSRNSTYTFCPWGIDIDTLPGGDILFGHFDIVNFKMNSFKVCDHGEDSEKLIQKYKQIITGHFHTRQHKIYENNSSILYLGSPFQMDFGDREQERGITILDTDSMNTEFVSYTTAPVHKKILLTDIIEHKENLEDFFKDLNGNFINLVVNTRIDEKILDVIKTKITQKSPRDVRVDFNSQEVIHQDLSTFNAVGVDIPSTINEFVQLMDISSMKDKVYTKTIEIYNNSI